MPVFTPHLLRAPSAPLPTSPTPPPAPRPTPPPLLPPPPPHFPVRPCTLCPGWLQVRDPVKRWGVRQIQSHPFFSGVAWEALSREAGPHSAFLVERDVGI